MAAIANGNPVPSSNQKCRIRRNAREKGISQSIAFNQWMEKQNRKRLPVNG
jgi:hypothetical protein